jgi:hypothetical protein
MMTGMRAIGLGLVVVLLAALVGVTAFRAGLDRGVTHTVVTTPATVPGEGGTPGSTVLVPAPGYGWAGYGHGYGWHPFGFVGPILGILVLFFLLKLVFFGFWGGRGGWGGRRDRWDEHAREVHDAWHRAGSSGGGSQGANPTT